MSNHPVVPPTVLRHFATLRDEVFDLAVRDPAFGDMCEEFAEAEDAMTRIEQLPVGLREERLEECQGWIESLIAEMEQALLTAKVIPLPHRPGRRLP